MNRPPHHAGPGTGRAESAPLPGSFLALLSDEQRRRLDARGTVHAFPPGAALVVAGEPGDRVMALLTGRVKVARTDEGGQERLLSIRDAGELIGELSAVDRLTRVATVTALEPTRALVVAAPVFRSYLEESPGVAVLVLEIVGRRLRQATERRTHDTSRDTLARVCGRLLELAERYGEPDGDAVTFSSPLTHEELVAWTGASRAGVSAALSELRRLGWIATDRRQVTLRDLGAVRRRATG